MRRVLRHLPRPRRAWLLVLVALVVVACRPAAALDEAGRCFRDKMRASRVAASATFACRARGGSEARVARCLARLDRRVARLVAAADARASEGGFACPGGAESLGLTGASSWASRLLGDGAQRGIGSCADLQVQAARRYAAAVAECALAAGTGGDAGAATDCQATARATFLAAWQRAMRGGACTMQSASDAASRIEREVAETASRLQVRCGDGVVGGFEACDDGNTADGDGCSSGCRVEDCAGVGDEVRCVACPEGSVAGDAPGTCRCPDGFEGEPGSCVDVDECDTVPDACPDGRPCVNLPGTYACAIECTAAAFEAALADCGAPSGAIAFDCEDTVIPVPAGDRRSRDVACDRLVIDGAGRGITFELDPLCWRTPLLAEQCPEGLAEDGTCRCPDVDSGDQFLMLRGDGNTVRDLTVRGFFDGIPVRGRDNLVEDVRFDRMCDDAFGSVATGVGNLFRRLDVRNGCDKCSENGGSVADTDPDPRVREHYNGIVRDSRFERCRTPLRVASSGRFLFDRVTMIGGDPDFPCDGPRFSAAGGSTERVSVRLEDSRVEGCRHGVRIGQGTDAVLRGDRIAGCALRGIRANGDAQVSLEGTTVEDNGGAGSVETGFGGVAAVGGAMLDLGGGALAIDGATVTSRGRNSVCRNRAPTGQARDLDTGGLPVAATGNWWCSVDAPLERIAGEASLDPVLDRAPLDYPGPR